ncbi:hypothetical protein LSM04_007834 [Trypanosoma melophagium]|uniref:uncharacterized protein n=1 Tax=Trypanosoma melophagium TaxID=715481 RepID=UPI00351A86BE|nr:hypothetical protein LSM04_007834 [Trypanosoma melophagium]
MKDRLEQLRADAEKAAVARQRAEQRLLEQHPYLEALEIAGLPLSELGLSDDDEFVALAKEHATLAASPRANAEALAANEQSLRTRAAQLAATLVKKEAALREQMPYLDHLPVDVPLRELHLESDPEFTALLARYAAVCSEPERAGGPEAKRLEKAMHDLAGKIAEDVATARHRALVEAENLHEKYPYIPEEPAPGVALVEVGVHEDPTFRKLANELEDLRTDPVKNAEQIAAVESAVCARALELAAMKLHATEEECHKYPFLSKRVDGVLLSDLDLADDAVFQEMVERRGAMTSEPQRNREALAEVESQLRDRASCVAAMKKAVDALRADEDEDVRAHNPFLEMNEVKSVPLRELGLPSDPQYAALADERLLLKQHPVPNAAAIVATENALRSRAEEIALARLTAEDELLNRHPSFAALIQEEKEAERAAAAQREALHARYPMLARDATEAVEKDAMVAALLARRSELLKDPVGAAEAIADVDELLRERGAEVEAARKRRRRPDRPTCLLAFDDVALDDGEMADYRTRRQRHRRARHLAMDALPEEAAGEVVDVDTQLPPKPQRALELVKKDPYYQELNALRDTLVAEGKEVNAPAIQCVEEQMKDRLEQLRADAEKAAVARQRAEQRLLEQHPYLEALEIAGLPLSELGLSDDDEFVALAKEHATLAASPRANAEALAANEQSLRTRAAQLAATLVKKEAALREQMPYLDHLPVDVPLRELHLESDPEFTALLARYAAVCSEPERAGGPEAKRLEKAMHDLAGKIAEDVATARHRALVEAENLHEKYPYIPEEPAPGVALVEVGVHEDPTFRKLANELEDLRTDPVKNAEQIAAVESAVCARALELAAMKLHATEEECHKYPFLSKRVDGVLLSDLDLADDAVFQEMVERRGAMTSEPQRNREALAEVESQLRDRASCVAAMKKAVDALRADEDEDVRAHNPFLEMNEVKSVPLRELGLPSDPQYAALADERLLLKQHPVPNAAAIVATENALRSRAEEIALARLTAEDELLNRHPSFAALIQEEKEAERAAAAQREALHARYPMLARDATEAVEKDAMVAALLARRSELLKDPVGAAEAIADVDELLRERGAEVEAARKRRRRPDRPTCLLAFDDVALDDGEMADYRTRRQRHRRARHLAMDALPEEAAGEVVDVDTQLPPKPQRALELVKKDPYYQELNALRDTLVAEGKEVNAPAIQCVEEQMKDRLEQLRADAEKAAVARQRAEQRLLEQHPYLEALEIAGLPLSELGLSDDDEFVALAKEHATLAASPRANAEALAANEQSLRTRAAQLAATLVKKEAALREQMPYLDHLPVDVPLRELHLESDPEFTALLARYAAVCSEPERAGGPEAKRLEKAMHDLAGKIAEDVATARHRALVEAENLHEKYPYIPEEPAPGVALVEVGVHEDPTFRKLANELEDLRTDPVKNAEQIAAVESAVCARALELAAMKLHATEEECHKYPFLSKRVDGVLLSDLDLADDAVFQEMVERRGAMTSEPQRNREALAEVESQLRDRASCVAAMKKAVDALRADEDEDVRAHNPFLEMNEVKSVPLRELGLPSDPQYAALADERLLLKQHPVPNAAAIVATENALRSRAEEIALARLTAEDELLNRHPSFAALIQEEKEAERAAAAQREALHARYPMLARDATEAVEKDAMVAALLARRSELLKDPVGAAEAIADVDELLRERGAEVEAARKRRRRPDRPTCLLAFDDVALDDGEMADYRTRRQRHRRARHLAMDALPEEAAGEVVDVDTQLPPKPQRALELVKKDPYYQELNALRDTLVTEGKEVNAPAIQCVEEQMKDRLEQLRADAEKAAVARQRAEQRLLEQHPYLEALEIAGLPLSELGLSDDDEFVALAKEHATLAASPRANAEALAANEQSLRTRAAQLAATLVKKEAALREQMPYLDHLPVDVPLRELHLESDPEFTALLARYAAVCSEPERAGGPEAKRLEKAMHDLAGKIAEDVATARHRALVEAENLHEKYPYIPEEPAPGVALVEVGVHEDPTFRKLANELEDLRTDPVKNAEQIAAVESAVCARALELAAMKLHATEEECHKYPFLSKRVDGVLLSDLDLADDAVFQEMVERRGAMTSEPQRNREALAEVESQLRDRASCVAAMKKAVDALRADEDEDVRAHNPFLEMNEVKSVPLRELGLPSDPQYAALADERLLLKQHPVPNAAAIVATENALRSRAEEIALARLTAEDELLNRHPSFAALIQEEKEAERAAAAQREALHARYPMLAPIADVDELLRERGAEVEAARKRRRRPDRPTCLLAFDDVALDDGEMADYRTRRQRHRRARHLAMDALPEEAAGEVVDVDTQLPPKPQRALELVKKDPYYQELNALRDTLVAEGKEVNAPAIQCVEEQMKDRLEQLRADAEKAAVARQRAEQRLLEQHPYLEALEIAGLPLSELGLSDDDEFVALAKEHATLAASPRANAEALAANEQSLRTRAAQLAATLVKKEAALREQMPYLDHLPVDVPLRELHLESDPEFTALLARYAAVCSEPERAGGPEAKRLEKAMHDLAGKIAEDVATARHRALVEAENLHEKYPYIPEEPAPGVALVEVGVHEDPTFRKLANELEDLRTDPVKNAEQIAAVESAVCARALELAAMKLHATEEECHKYPFLSKRVDGVLLSDLDLADDAVFQEMVERRGAMTSEPQRNREALAEVESQLRDRASCVAAMKKAVDALRADEDEDVRAHNPFLEMNEVKSVPLRELGLPSDPQYAALADERLLLKQHPVPNAAAIVATENALRSRAEEIALARLTAEDELLNRHPSFAALIQEEKEAERAAAAQREALHARYPMLARDATEAVEKDAMVAALLARRSELLKDPVGAAEAIADVDELLRERGAEVEAARKRRRRPDRPTCLLAFDDVALDDGEMADYRTRRQRHRRARHLAMDALPEEAAGEVVDVDTQLPPKPQRALELVKKDPYYQELNALRDTLVAEGKEVNAPAIQCVEEQMKDRLEQLRADAEKAAVARQRAEQRLLEQHPYLEALEIAGLPLSELGLSDDDEFVALAKEHATLAASPRANAEALAANEQSLRTRAAQLAATLVKKEAALREQMPYLDHLPVDVPLRELHLESDPEFTALLARYAAVCSEPERAGGPEAKRLEKAMHDLAGKIAEDVATARHRALVEAENLHEKYPYIPEEPAPGVALVEVGVHEDPTFCKLANELEDLRTDPVKNAEQIAAVESAVCARALELAAMKLHATEEECHKYPFLSKRVDGVLLSDLDLADDAVFQEMVERRGAMTSEPQRNREALAEVESQLRDRASCVAAMKKAVDALRADEDEDVRAHNPFLEMNEVKSVPLRELGLPSDPQYAALADERLLLKQHPVPNAAAIVATENALRSRAEEIALARLTAEDELLNRHPSFAALIQEEKEAERAAAAQREALHARYPMLARDATEAVEKDAMVAALLARRSELLKDPVGAAEAIADVDELLRERGAEVEAARKRRRRPDRPTCLLAFDDVALDDGEMADYRTRRQRHRRARHLAMDALPEEAAGEVVDVDTQLPPKPQRALELVKKDPYYQELNALRDTLVAEGKEVNAPAIQCVEEQMKDRLEQLRADAEKAAVARQRAEQRLLEQHPYLEALEIAGLPLSELGLSDDDEFVALAKEHATLAASPRANAEALAANEQSLRTRAAQLAATLVKKEAALREQMPYLDHLPVDVPLRELHLESDPEFTALLARYAAVCSEPERAGGPEAKRLEKAMHDLAGKIAEDVATARHRALVEAENLHEKYPYIPEEPAPGVALVEVGVHEDPTFRKLANELEDLRTDPVKNAEQIAAVESAVCARALELAAMKLHATEEECHKYPFLSKRVDGVLLSDLDLADDAVFQEMVERRGAMTSEPQRNREALAEVESQLRDRASCVAAMKKAVDALRADEDEDVRAHNPFLEMNEVKSVPLRELGLPSDPQYAALADERLLLKQHPVPNAAAIVATENALRSRAEEIALARLTAEDELLNRHPSFAALIQEEKEAERAAAAQREALHARYPMLARDATEAVEKDAMVAALLARRSELLKDPVGAAEAIADVDELLRERGAEVEAARKRRRRPDRPTCLLAFDDVALDDGEMADYRTRRQRHRRARHLAMDALPEEAAGEVVDVDTQLPPKPQRALELVKRTRTIRN